MNLKRLFTHLVALLAITLLAACAQMAVPKPKTFDDNVAVALSTNAKVRRATAILFEGGAISHATAKDIQQRADEARKTIDLARGLVHSDVLTAESKLAAATAILKALDAELARKGAKQ